VERRGEGRGKWRGCGGAQSPRKCGLPRGPHWISAGLVAENVHGQLNGIEKPVGWDRMG